jgi:hypothetical protein
MTEYAPILSAPFPRIRANRSEEEHQGPTELLDVDRKGFVVVFLLLLVPVNFDVMLSHGCQDTVRKVEKKNCKMNV